MLLSEQFVGIVGQALVHQMGRYQLSRTYNASWGMGALPNMDLHTALLKYQVGLMTQPYPLQISFVPS